MPKRDLRTKATPSGYDNASAKRAIISVKKGMSDLSPDVSHRTEAFPFGATRNVPKSGIHSIRRILTMKLRNIGVAALAASLAATACAVCASAEALSKVDLVTLNCNSDTDKLVQFSLMCLPDATIDEVVLEGVVSVSDDGTIQGGGQVGYNAASGWVQKDYNLDDEFVEVEEDGTVVVTINTADVGLDNQKGADDGLIQLGWWWGSGDGTFELTDIKVNGTSIVGNEAVASEDSDDGVVPEELYEEDGADETVVVTAGDVEAATDSSKGSPDTGIADVAAIAGLGILAAGAVVVSRKRK